MKTVKIQLGRSIHLGLPFAVWLIAFCSCSLEEVDGPFTGPDECMDLSSRGFITIDTDSILWSWGKYGHSGDSIEVVNIQPMTLDAE